MGGPFGDRGVLPLSRPVFRVACESLRRRAGGGVIVSARLCDIDNEIDDCRQEAVLVKRGYPDDVYLCADHAFLAVDEDDPFNEPIEYLSAGSHRE
jgi:hypothetical protein